MVNRTSAGAMGWLHPLFILIASSGAVLGSAPATNAEIVTVGIEEAGLSTLSEAEQATLDALLGVRQPLLLSDVSPDGSTVVVASMGRINPDEWQVQFLNLQTGELISSQALDYEIGSPEIDIRWLNNDTIQFFQEGLFGPQELVTINRNTEIVSHMSVYPTQAEEGEVLGIAPDFSKFVIRVYGEAEDTVYMVFLPSLDRVKVARLPEGFDIKPPAWSETGDQVVLVTSSVEESSFYERTPHTPSLGTPVIQDALGRLSPEENPFRQRSEVKVFDFSRPEPLQFELKATAEAADFFANAAISPDGQHIMVKLYQPGRVEGRPNPTYLFPRAAYYRFYTLDGTLQESFQPPELSGPVESQGTFLDEDTALFWSVVGTNRHLFTYDLSSQTLVPLPLPAGSVDPNSITVTPDRKQVIYTFSSVTQPPEIFSVPVDGSQAPQQISQINQPLAEVNRVRVDSVSFSTAEGERQGFLVQPQEAAFPPQNVPIVFWQQGGPGFAMINEFAVEVEMPLNLLPNFGLPVLAVPLAGREGFGPDVYQLQADGDNFGTLDITEGAEIVSQMVSQGWTRPGQVGITGCSYGGYYSSQAIARFPRVFAAANPQCSLLDTLTEWQLGYASLLSYLVGKTPMEATDRYRQMSPLYIADKIRTPTMLFHGGDDYLQIDMARNFHDVIAANAVPVMLYEFEGMGHGLTDASYQRTAAQLQIDFFRRYLTPSPVE